MMTRAAIAADGESPEDVSRRHEQPAQPLEEERHGQGVKADRDLHEPEEPQRASRDGPASVPRGSRPVPGRP